MKYLLLLSAGGVIGWLWCALFSGGKRRRPETLHWYYDYHLAEDQVELSRVLRNINESGYYLVSVVQDKFGMYTVIFRRCDA